MNNDVNQTFVNGLFVDEQCVVLNLNVEIADPFEAHELVQLTWLDQGNQHRQFLFHAALRDHGVLSFVLDDEVVLSHEVLRVDGVAALADGVELFLHIFERHTVGAIIKSQEVLCFGWQLNSKVETHV